jgi:ribosomal protein S18|tara:strand:- start:781 stop:1191 length:411 start_codon:yes stop_codon:yes gene_type:complete
MELIIFYGFGVISVSIAWLLYKGDRINKQNDHMLSRLQHHLNISSLREADFNEKIGDVEARMGDINSAMKKDSYASISKQNQRLDKLYKDLDILKRIVSEEKAITSTAHKNLSEQITVTKNTLDALRNDPNMISRY